ncbi:hypothetical protein [Brackiella oedipodis]|uniref:hypothetical protein n=1 Tax=Brackiella oedipodis TaxID=124225 RepID=UPI000687FCE8|nr:hypothetical protein [Brackiella oedipodis]
MKKFIWCALALVLAGCASNSTIDLSNTNNFGLKCSKDAATAPDWNQCIENANKTCGAQKAVNIQQHEPTGSGSANDGYFVSFQCG